MPDPATVAQWVLESKSITGVPALALHDIAKREHIRVRHNKYHDEPDFCGELLFKGDARAILINTAFGPRTRHTFTFAHELGHYFLKHGPTYTQDEASGILCTVADLRDRKGMRATEREANAFAAALLMPESLFRLQTLGAPFDFDLINNLARDFHVSKQSCCFRILDFIQIPCAVIYSEGLTITAQKSSLAAGNAVIRHRAMPPGTIAHSVICEKRRQAGFVQSDPAKWLLKYSAGTSLYECTRGHFEHGVAMTLLRW